jgi:polyketide biosynthesis enoyl-CoA hydratase PksI
MSPDANSGAAQNGAAQSGSATSAGLDAAADELVDVTVNPPLAIVRLRDSAGQNRISVALGRALVAKMDLVGADPAVKVVVLQGLPDVFCMGADVEELLGDGVSHTLDGWNFVRAAANCPLPVVAAAQGHAMGGGLLLALYADVTVLSESSSYAANFVSLGFTPCLGTTYLLPAKLGAALASEMIFTGRAARGRELAARGTGICVAPPDRVLHTAETMALRIAQAPRETLVMLKRQLAAAAKAQAEGALGREIIDHHATLTARAAG